MNIFSPINPSSDIAQLSTVADEFYCGVMDPIWEKTYSPYIGYNTRGFSGSRANYPTWESFAQAIANSNSHHVHCYLTVNSHNITQSQLPLIRDIIQEFKHIGGSGIICSELNGICIAKQEGLRAYLSTNISVYNVQALRYLERAYDFDRIILSRDMRMEDIRRFRDATDKEIEVFGQNLGCRFSNGLCYCTHHCRQGGMCKASMDCRWSYFSPQRPLTFLEEYDAKLNHFVYSEYLLKNACALCALYDLVHIGIDCIKVVGRELSNAQIYSSCLALKECIALAQSSASRAEYQSRMIENTKFSSGVECLWGLQCYYPEVSNPDLIKGVKHL